jgi:membrane-anchored protein YejM (alkaline phosphatase superfamily)
MTRVAILGRFALAAVCIGSAGWGVIAYLPFTYKQVIESNIVPQLTLLARYQPWLYAAAAAWVAISLWGDRRRLSRLAGALLALSAIGNLIHPLLPMFRSDARSLLLGTLSLTPLVMVGVADWLASARAGAGGWRDSATGDAFSTVIQRAAIGSAVFVSVVSFSVAAMRVMRSGEGGPVGPELAAGWSLLAHLLMGMAFFLGAAVARELALRVRYSFATELGLDALLLGGTIYAVLVGVIFRSLSFRGHAAHLVAAATALAIAVMLSGIAMRRLTAAGTEAEPLALLVAPWSPAVRSRIALALVLIALAVLAGALTVAISRYDWNGLMQQLIAVLLWFTAFSLLIQDRHPSRWRGVAAALPAAVILAAFELFSAAPRLFPGSHTAALPSALQGWSSRDPSVRILTAALLARESGTSDDFYALLQRNTNLPHSVRIQPVSVDFQKPLMSRGVFRPHIFIIVVDSLRRDYLGAYNPRVSFTPGIDRFARESIVFSKAFTPYGATGLSEPAHWVGGLIPHQQYPKPFYPMNALAKLLTAENYRQYVSIDPILAAVLPRTPRVVPLDEETVEPNDYYFCRSLADLREKLSRDGTDESIFVYTKPLDIHVSTITREGATIVQPGSYGGFYPPYASRVARIDRCFGSFVEDLKRHGIWDDSVVILTSDHGDSLGEEGRWGHAYTLFPEVVRIPFLMRIPQRWLAGRQLDSSRVLFTTDITPTLYDLLGHPPSPPSFIFGTSLFASGRAEDGPRARMMASSYGPVYGMLDEDGEMLYLADAVNYRDYAYALRADGTAAEVDVRAALREEGEQIIRQHIAEITRFYQIPSPGRPVNGTP